MRSRLRSRLQNFLQSQPRPVRLERQAAPQVRALESRFVLDASAAMVGWDALGSHLDVETVELSVDDSIGTIQLFSDGSSGGMNQSSAGSINPPAGPISPSNAGIPAGEESFGLRLADGLDVSLGESDQDATVESQISVLATRGHASARANEQAGTTNSFTH